MIVLTDGLFRKRMVSFVSKSKYVKPEIEIERYEAADVMTASTDSQNDLHNTDDYNYGGN